MDRVAIYCRCSTARQGEKDLSIPAQLDAARPCLKTADDPARPRRDLRRQPQPRAVRQTYPQPAFGGLI